MSRTSRYVRSAPAKSPVYIWPRAKSLRACATSGWRSPTLFFESASRSASQREGASDSPPRRWPTENRTRSASVSIFAGSGFPASGIPPAGRSSRSSPSPRPSPLRPRASRSPTSAIPRSYSAAAASRLSAPWMPRTISTSSRAVLSASSNFFESEYICESAESDSAASALFGPAAFTRRSSDVLSAFSASGNSARFENVVPIVCSTEASTRGWFASEVSALSCAWRSASRSDTLREPFDHGSAAPSASRRNASIALAFAASAVARSRSRRTRPASTTSVTPSATRRTAITPAAADHSAVPRDELLQLVHACSAGARGSAGSRGTAPRPRPAPRRSGSGRPAPSRGPSRRSSRDRRPAERLRRLLADDADRLHDRHARASLYGRVPESSS